MKNYMKNHGKHTCEFLVALSVFQHSPWPPLMLPAVIIQYWQTLQVPQISHSQERSEDLNFVVTPIQKVDLSASWKTEKVQNKKITSPIAQVWSENV